MRSPNWVFKMNENKVRDLVRKLKIYVDQLEGELSCQPHNYSYNASLHEEIKIFEEWYDGPDV